MTIVLALLLEHVLGDPSNRWHPVAWFGRWAAWLERLFYADNRLRGLCLWAAALVPPLTLILMLESAIPPAWQMVFDAFVLWFCLGWRSLFRHVHCVLTASDVARARAAVSHIVSRDVQAMELADARRAALESLAENASDAVVAPLMWFLVLGMPAAVVYRMVNTLDAMWGYRNPRYLRFGWFAARMDDLVSWLPARITAAALLLLAGRMHDWPMLIAQARMHESPNAGWPEASLALAAGIRLGGPVMREGKLDVRPGYGPPHAREVDEEVSFVAVGLVNKMLTVVALLVVGLEFVR
ncbi:MAG: cobalamin biosynthesis protein CobD [Zetaproteobacteria bacterium]|nr:MAG: cobalamin biosynthesis protein CobD [Zetaproteobacteria bacterium]